MCMCMCYVCVYGAYVLMCGVLILVYCLQSRLRGGSVYGANVYKIQACQEGAHTGIGWTRASWSLTPNTASIGDSTGEPGWSSSDTVLRSQCQRPWPVRVPLVDLKSLIGDSKQD